MQLETIDEQNGSSISIRFDDEGNDESMLNDHNSDE
jgi:hypothetical protein